MCMFVNTYRHMDTHTDTYTRTGAYMLVISISYSMHTSPPSTYSIYLVFRLLSVTSNQDFPL